MNKKSSPQAKMASLSIAIITIGSILFWRAQSAQNKVALTDLPKRVEVVQAQKASYRPHRTYVGQIFAWTEADVGPQLISGYVDTVLVRPGAAVKRGEVIATIDCRNPSAQSRAVSMQARALDARQQAVAHESSRIQGLLTGGFVSSNSAERAAAENAAELATLAETRAKLVGSSLEVNDCVLRAPFDGEISRRLVDPGGFVGPGKPVVSVIDRRIIRIAADAPEKDFALIGQGTQVKICSTAVQREFQGVITRRAPSADPDTRTIHFEIDISNQDRSIPVGTTVDVSLNIAEAVPALRLPLSAVAIRGKKVSLFVVEKDICSQKSVALIGEEQGDVLVDLSLGEGTQVVTEGRALLETGDRVVAITRHGADL